MNAHNDTPIFKIASIANSLIDKQLIPLDFTFHSLEWQSYFGYHCDKPRFSSALYHTQDYYELIIHLRSGRKYAINDMFGCSAMNYAELLEEYGFTPEKIAEAAAELL